MKRLNISFASRLTLYILTLTTLIFLSIVVVFHRYSRLREERQAVNYTSVLQEKLIQRVDFELEEVESTVKSEVYRVRHVKDNPDNIMPIVRSMVRSDSLIMGGSIAFVKNYYAEKGELFMEYAYKENRGGEKRLVTRHMTDSTYYYPDMPWFKDAVEQERGVWSDPYYDEGGGNKMMTTYAYPVRDDDGNIFAVITADVSLEALSLNISTIRPYPDSYSFIVSRKGTYIAHPDKRNIMHSSILSRARDLENEDLAMYGRKMVNGERGSFRSSINGVEVLACYAPLSRTRWSICSICPYHTVMAQLGSTFGVMAAIMLGGLVLLLLCIRMLVKFTVKPIRQLTEATRQVASGNFEFPLPHIDTRDDLRVLRDSFEYMQSSLLDYVKELESNTRQRERIKSELTIAHDIQMNIVPKEFSPFAECGELELYASLRPAKEVGGDLYDFFIRDDKLFFCIGDVSGKGIPASLVMAITSTLFRMTANSFDQPQMIVAKLNDTIANNNEANMFVTMFVGVLDLRDATLTFCNAGHNPPVLVGRDGACRFLDVDANLPVGVMAGVDYTQQEIRLNDGQSMLLYTDGLTEAENMEHEAYGDGRTLESAASHASCAAREMIENMQKDLSAFTGAAEQSDDLTIMCVSLDKAATAKESSQPAEDGNIQHARSLRIENRLEESEKLVPFIESVGNDLRLSPQVVSSLTLALEEALVNVILYAYSEGEKGKIELRTAWNDGDSRLTFELVDSGKPFDPTKAEEADITLGVEERPIGGLGILLMRKIMDTVDYRREGEKNILIMSKNIARG